MQHTHQPNDLSRRETLRRLAWLPIQVLGLGALSTITIPNQSGEILTHCAAGIVACEHLSKGKHDDITSALAALSTYLPPLTRIVKEDSAHRKEAARLSAQALLLKATLGLHREGTGPALRDAKLALTYSEESNDISLQLAILIRFSWMQECANQHPKALELMLKAKHLLEHTKIPIHPMIRSTVYGSTAKRLAFNALDDSALLDLRHAHESFFVSHDLGEMPFYAAYSLGDLIQMDGQTHCRLGKYDQALDTFSQAIDLETLSPKIAASSERVRIEIINNANFALMKSTKPDMDRVIKLWEAGVQGANDLLSEQRFREVEVAYEMMQVAWPTEERIKNLRGQLGHW